MRATLKRLLVVFLCLSAGAAQQNASADAKKTAASGTDLKSRPTLYVVGYAHLDTQWRWEYPQTIGEFLSKTMRNNFALFEKYPHYIFNFTGANRYRLMKEYYPEDFTKLKQYVAAGRWFPAGSSMEEGDVNSPNAESIIRQILYGNEFFRREFGKASNEYMLPDCFGFPASLPSILHHAGVKGFSTQKLSSGWQPAPHVGGPDSPEKTPDGIPFNVGIWEGTDGSTIIAALNPLSYTSTVIYDLSKVPPPPPAPDPNLTQQQNSYRARPKEDWVKRLQIDGDLTGIKADYHYVGTGDIGGAPNESSVALMEAIVTKSKTALPGPPRTPQQYEEDEEPGPATAPPVQVGDGPVHVEWSKADQMFNDILACCNTARMPRYKGDLELINHSAGSITSEAYQKRWMRKNELLADAAEKASLAASWLGARPYPQDRLNAAWTLVMGGQFHDILPGTATPKAFEFAWNDDIIAMNQFAGVLSSATESVAAAMNTEVEGIPIAVFNPLNIEREDVVEANVRFPTPPVTVEVVGPDGAQVLARHRNEGDGTTTVLFVAKAPAVGYAVYDVRGRDKGFYLSTAPRATESFLENERFLVKLDQNGDVSSIFDHKLNREILSGPIRLAISTDNPEHWPAWNMDFADEQRAPRSYVSGPAKITVIEPTGVRAAVRIERETEGSKFVQIIRLSSGDAGNRIEFVNSIDWNTKEANLKAVFPLAASNPNATYNWDIGTIQRPNAFDRQFEVASHQWIDLTDQAGGFGATVLTDCKNASDKPNDNTLRLTLIRTPGTRGGYTDQGTQDIGHHEILFGLAPHENDWRTGSDWQAYRLNDPLVAFESSKHPGALGKQFSLVHLNNPRIRMLALKKAEHSDEVVVRLVEMDGKPASNVHVTFAAPVIAAREINGQEQPLGSATVQGGELVTSFTGYEPRSFAVRIAAVSNKLSPPQFQPVTLPYDVSVASLTGNPASGCFDCSLDRPASTPQGKALPAEMLPYKITYAGFDFPLAPTGHPNAVIPAGQTVNLPAGNFNRIYLLAAAVDGDHVGTFKLGDQSTRLNIQEWTGFVGQWDDRIWKSSEEELAATPGTQGGRRVRIDPYAEMVGLKPGFIKRADIAWFASHRHDAAGANEPYAYSYLFVYALDLPHGAKTLTLPNNPNIRVLAATVVSENGKAWPAQPLYDVLEGGTR